MQLASFNIDPQFIVLSIASCIALEEECLAGSTTAWPFALTRDESDLVPIGKHTHSIDQDIDTILRESQRGIDLGQFPSEKIGLLKGQDDQLSLVDKEFTAIFDDVEAKLYRAGISTKINPLREFRQHYERQIAALKGQMDRLMHAKQNANPGAIDSQIQLSQT